MKKKIDFSLIVAIALLGLYGFWVLLHNSSLSLVYTFGTASAPYEHIEYMGLSNLISIYSTPLWSLLPPLLLIIGLIAKRNRLVLSLGVALLAGQRLNSLPYNVMDTLSTILEYILDGDVSFSSLRIICYNLTITTIWIATTIALALILLALMRKKPLPTFLQAPVRFLPVLPLFSSLLYPLIFFTYPSYSYHGIWVFFKAISNEYLLYPFFNMIPSMLLYIGLVFAADAIVAQPNASHKKVTVLIGAGGSGLFLLGNLLSCIVAIITCIIHGYVSCFGHSLLDSLLWLLCYGTIALGLALIPVATLRFSNTSSEDMSVVEALPEEKTVVPSKPLPPKYTLGALGAELSSFKQLQEEGLISQADYEIRKSTILSKPLPSKLSLPNALRELKRLQENTLLSPEDYTFKKDQLLAAAATPCASGELANALQGWKQLQEEGLISSQDYETKKKELLSL